MTAGCDPEQFFQVLKTRRVVRSFTDEPIPDADLWKLAQAGRWASSGGNMHPHRFLITRDRHKIHLVRMFSPGMLTEPPALIVLLTDTEAAARQHWKLEGTYIHWVDTGTSAQNMMNMAHALGLGTCPVTSFSKTGVSTVLGLPPHLIPELLLMVGHPRPVARALRESAPKPVTTKELTFWEEPGRHDP